jgi:hypothetical protein
MVNSFMVEAVWKIWALEKCKVLTWLILQDHVWMEIRLQKRGCPSCGNFQLRKRKPETADHTLFKSSIGLGFTYVDTSDWTNLDMVNDWWLRYFYTSDTRGISFAYPIMLTCWKIWNEPMRSIFASYP